MAAGRKPGPLCADNDPIDLDDGSLCLAQMPPPGPLGFSLDERNQAVANISQQDIEIALAAIRQETNTQIGEVLRNWIPQLIVILNTLRTTVINPCASSLEPPTRPISGVKDILALLGLDFLLPSLSRSSGELIFALTMGVSRVTAAWGPDVVAHETDTGHVARAIGILVRLILQGIVRYVPAVSQRVRSAIAAWEARTNGESPGARNNAFSVLLARLRVSRFGEPFATWIDQHWDALLKNARLQLAASVGEGSIFTMASQFVSLRESNVTVAPTPAADPPTFPAGTNLAAQAVALVAAAAQGTPFCPI